MGVQIYIVPSPSCTRGQGEHDLWLASLHVRPFQRGKTGDGALATSSGSRKHLSWAECPTQKGLLKPPRRGQRVDFPGGI